MHRKDYVKAAGIVKKQRNEARSTSRVIGPKQRLYEESVAIELENAFVELFQGDNPRFDKNKFLDACGSAK